jgi:hypothetical protein
MEKKLKVIDGMAGEPREEASRIACAGKKNKQESNGLWRQSRM